MLVIYLQLYAVLVVIYQYYFLNHQIRVSTSPNLPKADQNRLGQIYYPNDRSNQLYSYQKELIEMKFDHCLVYQVHPDPNCLVLGHRTFLGHGHQIRCHPLVKIQAFVADEFARIWFQVFAKLPRSQIWQVLNFAR